MTGWTGTVASRPSSWSAWVDRSCAEVEVAGQWRKPRRFDARGPSGRLAADDGPEPASPWGPGVGPTVVSFASNDYLGLSCHPGVVAAAHVALDRWGTGSGASRLVTGSRPVHDDLEAALAALKGCERAVVFPTGFAANLSVLSVFGTEEADVFSDAWNHASIIDGCRLARASVHVYPHGDLGQLDAMLAASRRRTVIVSDSVFSMDGDAADLEGLVRLAHRHGALLVLDEAHAVLGPDLADVAGAGREDGGVDVLSVGTLSKTLGSLGGFVAGPARFIELLVNRARPYIFTTAPTPADAAAALAAVHIVQSPEGDRLRATLARHATRVAEAVGAGPLGLAHRAGHHRGRGRGHEGIGRAPGRGPVGAGHPSSHRPGGHVPAAGDAVGRPHRRAGRSIGQRAAGAGCERRRRRFP